METYEAADYRNVYARSMELAGYNQLFPEHFSFALPAMEEGARSVGSAQTETGYIPPVILKAIAWMESGWAQASYDPFVPYGEVGPTLVSHDCGYGIMQVTSGMQNVTGVPNLDQAMIGGHYAFNIARGARILADKWNQAPEFRPLVGNRDRGIIENWYYALWSYNGFAFKNHPFNPIYDPNRPPFSCGPADDGLGHNTGAYPYQELVMGCVAHPPVRGGLRLWDPVDVSLPNRADNAFAGPLALANWDACALSLACAAMDIPIPNPWHRDPTTPAAQREQVIGVPGMAVIPAVSLSALPGTDSLPITVTIENARTGVLAWRATTSAPWLKIDRAQGISLGSELGSRSQTLSVYASGVGLSPGTHTAQITVESLYGTGVPGTVPVTFFVSLQAGTILTGDITGDGKSDVLLPCCAEDVSLWRSTEANFSITTFRPWPGYRVTLGSWQAGDLNGDGRTDLVHICCESAVNIWFSRGDGIFDVRQFTPWGGYWVPGGSWQVGDFNGDGKADLAHTCCGGSINIWFSRGDGIFDVRQFGPWTGYSVPTGSWQAGDLNGDTKADLIHICCNNSVNIWLSRGDGTFDVRQSSPWAGYWVPAGSWHGGDFNGDGKADLAHVCCENAGSIWFSRGDGSFDVRQFSPWPGYSTAGGEWRSADLNGDNKTDLVHLCCDYSANTWLSRGDGTFDVGGFAPWPGYSMASGTWHVGDFNGDERADLLHRCCTYVNIWQSAGNGSFTVNAFMP